MPDQLVAWLPSLNIAADPASYFDWGDVAAAMAPQDKFFRVKNLSTAFTASGITVTFSDPGGSEDISVYQFLSLDGRRFTASVALPALPPGSVSTILTLRAVIPARALNGVQTFHLNLNVAAWEATVWPTYVLSPV